MHTPLLSTAILALGLAAAAPSARAHDGDLDRTFGRHGKVTTDFAHSVDIANAVAVQPDGRLVVVGTSYTGDFSGEDFAVARYDADGSLDATFNGTGSRRVDSGGCCQAATSVLLQADGRIVAAGFPDIESSDADFVLVRLTAKGAMDRGFGHGGKVRTSFGDLNGGAHGAALQADGRIVAVGFQATAGAKASQFAIARYRGTSTDR